MLVLQVPGPTQRISGLNSKYVIVRVETGVISLVGLLVSSLVTNSPHPASSFVTLKPNLRTFNPSRLEPSPAVRDAKLSLPRAAIRAESSML